MFSIHSLQVVLMIKLGRGMVWSEKCRAGSAAPAAETGGWVDSEGDSCETYHASNWFGSRCGCFKSCWYSHHDVHFDSAQFSARWTAFSGILWVFKLRRVHNLLMRKHVLTDCTFLQVLLWVSYRTKRKHFTSSAFSADRSSTAQWPFFAF